MTIQRFRDLVSLVITHAAQFAYAERTGDAVALLTSADRVFRAVDIGPSRGPAPLAEEITASLGLLQVARLVGGVCLDLSIDLDPGGLSSTFISPGALIDSIDAFVAEYEGKDLDGTLELSANGASGGLLLRGPGRSTIIAAQDAR